MPNTPINALPTPTNASPNLPPVHFDALANQLDTRLVPRFTNVAARDAAITAPVEGQVCHVAAQVSPELPPRLMVYNRGMWRLVGPTPLLPILGAWSEPAGVFGVTPTILTTVAVPDPGFPYRIQVLADCEVGSVSTGTRWDMWVRIDQSSNDSANFDYQIGSIELVHWRRIVSGISPLEYTGSARVVVEARRAYGTANGQIMGTNKKVSVYRHAS